MKKLLLIICLVYMNTFTNDITISVAKQTDIQDIANLHYESWHSSFKSMLDQKYVEQQTLEYLNKYWEDFFTAENNDKILLVARDQDKLLGFICAGPIKNIFNNNDYTGEVYQLYVSPQSQGMGIGSKLMKNGLDNLHNLGHINIIVRVFYKNMIAQKFYEKCGGEYITEEDFIDYHGTLKSKVYGFSKF